MDPAFPVWSLLVAAHATCATLAVVLGAVQLLRSPWLVDRRSGDRLHRWNGRVWVALELFVAGSSFWIHDLVPGHLSWIHILSVITIVSLVVGVVAIRRHDRVTHGITMSATYGGMIGALIGVIAVPVRLVPRSFDADWGGMTLLTLGLTAMALAGVLAMSVAVKRVAQRTRSPRRQTAAVRSTPGR